MEVSRDKQRYHRVVVSNVAFQVYVTGNYAELQRLFGSTMSLNQCRNA